MSRLAHTLAWLALHACAGFSLLVETGTLGHPVTPALEELPSTFGPLEIVAELPFDSAALGQQPPERCLFARLRAADGSEGRLFVAYYERAQRWSGRPHDVERCFAADGWKERESHRLAEAHRPWSRLLERAGEDGVTETIRVVHWLEHPGPDQDRVAWRELLARLGSGRGFRQDVASIYLEFPADSAPDDAASAAAVAALSDALERLW